MHRGRTLRAVAIAVASVLALGCGGSDRPAGEIEGVARPAGDLRAQQKAQDTAKHALASDATRGAREKRILFGDLHVHTTYSIDAFVFSLPMFAGEGAHPPADACDFARYCSSLDFFSLNDHAEGITPEHWRASIDNLRECNARAGDPADPDLVAFMGYEWTQVGDTPSNHWGHKNVIFPGTADSELPARPINSRRHDTDRSLFSGFELIRLVRWIDPRGWSEYQDFLWLLARLGRTPVCPRDQNTLDLPPDCSENAPTPADLFEKLAQWGGDSIVIPHGSTWGMYTPPTTSMDKQLQGAMHDPDRQILFEIMSGHGNSEEFRSFREHEVAQDGQLICPAPTRDYLPCCWRAGELMRERCGDLSSAECDARVEEVQQLAMRSNVSPHLLFPDARGEDWLDCGQCRDCFKPALGYRPRESGQYTLALSNFDQLDENGDPKRFRYGFMASSDNHSARPGTGYKQYERRKMTEATGARSEFFDRQTQERLAELQPNPERPIVPQGEDMGLLAVDTERVASFLYPGGLVAVHSEDRSRESIWKALKRREVYGTSGPRILLWFDLLNGPAGPVAMGSRTTQDTTPQFEVRAVGSFEPKDGCPPASHASLSPERLETLCRGECYYPSDRRRAITAIEIVRIRPQVRPGEPVENLIEDPWRRFPCSPDPGGCAVRFEDPEFRTSGRDALYYARAVEEESMAINGANLRTEFDAQGNPIRTTPCYGDYRTDFDEDCLAPVQERAWSSPIYIDQP